MANKSLQHSSLTDNIFYRSMLAGNDAYFPEFESDDFLEEVVLTTSASSVTFSGLASYATAGYKHLQIRIAVRGAVSGGLGGFRVQVNSDSSESYRIHRLYGNGSTVVSQTGSGSYLVFGDTIPNSGVTSGAFATIVLDLLDYASNSKNTTVRTLSGLAGSSSAVQLSSGVYLNTDAVTSLNLSQDFNFDLAVGSRFSLYGSKA